MGFSGDGWGLSFQVPESLINFRYHLVFQNGLRVNFPGPKKLLAQFGRCDPFIAIK